MSVCPTDVQCKDVGWGVVMTDRGGGGGGGVVGWWGWVVADGIA